MIFEITQKIAELFFCCQNPWFCCFDKCLFQPSNFSSFVLNNRGYSQCVKGPFLAQKTTNSWKVWKWSILTQKSKITIFQTFQEFVVFGQKWTFDINVGWRTHLYVPLMEIYHQSLWHISFALLTQNVYCCCLLTIFCAHNVPPECPTWEISKFIEIC